MMIIGHRGAKGLAPENTLASLQAALKHRVDEVEIDIRLTKDGVPVLIHDKDLRRLSHSPLTIAESSLEQLRAVKPDLATLGEALDLINRRVPVRIEVKPGVPTLQVIAEIEERLAAGWQTSDFAFASFNQKTLVSLHVALPAIETAVIARWFSAWAVHRAKQLGTKRLVMNQHFLWFGFVRAVSRRGYQLTPYVMNNPAKVARWQQYGLYGIVTDFPDRFEDR